MGFSLELGIREADGLFGKQFQPSEFMKLTLVFYLAAVFAKGKFRDHQGDTLLAHYLILLMIVGLVFIEPDLGTALVIFFIGYCMFFLAGVSSVRLFKMALCLIPLISIGMLMFPYQKHRFLNYWGSVPFSDFILASFGEEFGFLGIFTLFILLAIILWRGIRIAIQAPDKYGYLMAGGITIMILVNCLMNAGVVVNLFPTTGLPFPFMSYGGSSLFVHSVGVGILLNISTKGIVSYRQFTVNQSRRTRWFRDED